MNKKTLYLIILSVLLIQFAFILCPQAEEDEWTVKILGIPKKGTTFTDKFCSYYTTVDAGKIRGDDVFRIYAGYRSENDIPEMHEFEWNGSGWQISKYSLNVTQLGFMPPTIPINLVIANGRKESGFTACYLTASATNKLFEYTFSGTSFNCGTVEVPYTPGLAGGWFFYFGTYFHENLPVVYYGGSGDYFYELKYEGSSWKVNTCVMTPVSVANTYFNTWLWCGDARNDGKERLYIGSPQCGIIEAEKNGTTWSANFVNYKIMDPFSGNCAGFIASLRSHKGDNKKRIYAITDKLVEYSYTGGKFEELKISDSHTYMAITYGDIGDVKGHKDGITCLYALTYNDKVIEFTWNGTKFAKTYEMKLPDVEKLEIPNNYDWDTSAIKLYEGRKDGQARLYAINTSGYLFEYSFPPRSFRPDPGPGPYPDPDPVDPDDPIINKKKKIPSIMGGERDK